MDNYIMENLCYDENNTITYKGKQYKTVLDLPKEALDDYFSNYCNTRKITGGIDADFYNPASFDKSILEASIEIQK